MNCPLASFPLARTCDVDEAQSVLSRELSDLRFESIRDRQRFQFEMNGVRIGRTMIGFNRFSTESIVDAGVIENAVIVSFGVGGPAILDLDGESVGPDRLAIVAPPRRLRIHRSPASGVVVLRVGIELLEARLRETTGEQPKRPLVFERSADLDHGVGAQLQRLLTYVVDDATHTDALLQNPLLHAGLDDVLLSSVLALPSNYSDALQVRSPASGSLPLVRRAEEFMEANATLPITVADVVAECRCSRTALFSSFRRCRRYTPLQFLEKCRLNEARARLLHAAPTDTVTSIALSCGFLHLGRFAAAYRRRFGEKPSESIRR